MILLIIPPSPFLADERVFPFLGILKVASVLEEHGIEVQVMDLGGVADCAAAIRAYTGEPEFIGITATTPQFPGAIAIADECRDSIPTAKIIIGGPHATLCHSAMLKDRAVSMERRGTAAFAQITDNFDVVVAGDGERAILSIVNGNTDSVIDAGTLKSDLFLKRGTLEDFPLPARHLIDLSSYHYEIDGHNSQSMISQLGCPFGCGFCGGRNTPSLRVIRSRSIEHVMTEVDVLVSKYGYRGIMFYDDELNLNNAGFLELLDALARYQTDNSVDLRFRGFVKAELFTAEQAMAMYQAGFRVSLSGVESGDDGILKAMKKGTTAQVNSQWVRYCHEAGLQAKALMSIGHPGETSATVEASIRWVMQNRPDDVDWTIITQYPGSPYFDESVQVSPSTWLYVEKTTGNKLYSGVMDYAHDGGYYKGLPGDYTSYVWTDELSRDSLITCRDIAEKMTRQSLGLAKVSRRSFEHSMGQGLPQTILRTSK